MIERKRKLNSRGYFIKKLIAIQITPQKLRNTNPKLVRVQDLP
jgi:hypothetical protein